MNTRGSFWETFSMARGNVMGDKEEGLIRLNGVTSGMHFITG
jgi:hypothetical protein